MSQEPIHEAPSDAIGWVREHALLDLILIEPVTRQILRVDRLGLVHLLLETEDGWYWSSCRRLANDG